MNNDFTQKVAPTQFNPIQSPQSQQQPLLSNLPPQATIHPNKTAIPNATLTSPQQNAPMNRLPVNNNNIPVSFPHQTNQINGLQQNMTTNANQQQFNGSANRSLLSQVSIHYIYLKNQGILRLLWISHNMSVDIHCKIYLYTLYTLRIINYTF